jgi:peroxiredoxin Q/BCP
VAYFAASTDKPKTNRKFARSLELDYPILSDPTRETARAYGVLKAGLFAARHTFYIGADGKILFVDDKVRSASAGDDLAARLEELGVPPVSAAPGE